MMTKKMGKRKGFTIIEILIVVSIIGVLAAVILALWSISARNRAAVASYKTTMKSVQTAVELCAGTGGSPLSGMPGVEICDTNGDGSISAADYDKEAYPLIDSRCSNTGNFFISYDVPGNPTTWRVTTENSCRGCRLSCNSSYCSPIENPAGSCNPK